MDNQTLIKLESIAAQKSRDAWQNCLAQMGAQQKAELSNLLDAADTGVAMINVLHTDLQAYLLLYCTRNSIAIPSNEVLYGCAEDLKLPKYCRFTTGQLAHAFATNKQGLLEPCSANSDKIEHFGNFNSDYVTRVLNAYDSYRQKKMALLHKITPVDNTPRRPDLSPEEFVEVIYHAWVKHTTPVFDITPYSDVFNALKTLNRLTGVAEKKEAFIKHAIALAKQEMLDQQIPLDNKEKCVFLRTWHYHKLWVVDYFNNYTL